MRYFSLHSIEQGKWQHLRFSLLICLIIESVSILTQSGDDMIVRHLAGIGEKNSSNLTSQPRDPHLNQKSRLLTSV